MDWRLSKSKMEPKSKNALDKESVFSKDTYRDCRASFTRRIRWPRLWRFRARKPEFFWGGGGSWTTTTRSTHQNMFFFWETWQPTKMPLGLGFFKGFCWQLYYLLSFCGEDELVDRLLFFLEVSLHPTGRCYVSSFWFWSFGCIEKSNLSNCLFWWFPITT